MAEQISMRKHFLLQNPITVQLTVDSGLHYTYVLWHGTEKLYVGAFTSLGGDVRLALNGFFDLAMEKIHVGTFRLALQRYEVDVASHTFTVYRGGLPYAMYQSLRVADTDVFESRLLGNDRPFLLTAKYDGRLVVMPENEIEPLAFLSQNKVFDVVMDGAVVERVDTRSASVPISYLDIAAIRKKQFADTGTLCNVIDLRSDDVSHTTIVLTHSQPSRYAIRYANRFGMTERLALTDFVEVKVRRDGQTVAQFDPRSDLYHDVMLDASVVWSIVGTIELTPYRHDALMDLMQSRMVSLFVDGNDYRVNLSISEQIAYDDLAQPRILTVEMTPTHETEMNYGQQPTASRSVFQEIFNLIFS